MYKVAVTLALTLFLALIPAWAGAQVKIGVVDVNDILNKSPEGQRAQETIRRKAEELGRPLEQRRQDIGRQMEEFEKQAAVMKEDARKRRQEEIQRKITELQRQAQDADKTLAQVQEREMGPVLKKLERAVEEVANEDKLDIVLPKAGIFVRNKNLDITEKVRAKFR